VAELRNSPKTGLSSPETWMIILLLVIAGGALGYAAGQYAAQAQIDQVSAAYAEASKAKDELVAQCVARTSEAAAKISEAAEAVTKEATNDD